MSRRSIYEGTNGVPRIDNKVLHVDLKEGDVASRIITVGPESRAIKYSMFLDTITFVHTSSRGFTTYTGLYNGVKVSICSIGMGCPMMDMFVREVRNLFSNNETMYIVRVGTCGVLRQDVPVGSIVVCNGSIMISRDYDHFMMQQQNENDDGEEEKDTTTTTSSLQINDNVYLKNLMSVAAASGRIINENANEKEEEQSSSTMYFEENKNGITTTKIVNNNNNNNNLETEVPGYRISKICPSNIQLTNLLTEKLIDTSYELISTDNILNVTGESFYSTQGRFDSNFHDHNTKLIDFIIKKYPNATSCEMETFQLLHLAQCSSRIFGVNSSGSGGGSDGGGSSIRAASMAIALANRVTGEVANEDLADEAERHAGLAALKVITSEI